MSESTEHNSEHNSQRLRGPLSVFISYSRSDSVFVKDLANWLREAGCTVWQDISALRGGQPDSSSEDGSQQGTSGGRNRTISPESLSIFEGFDQREPNSSAVSNVVDFQRYKLFRSRRD